MFTHSFYSLAEVYLALEWTQLCCWVTPYILYTVSGVTKVLAAGYGEAIAIAISPCRTPLYRHWPGLAATTVAIASGEGQYAPREDNTTALPLAQVCATSHGNAVKAATPMALIASRRTAIDASRLACRQ